jgi:hypothetical protein
MEVDIDRLMTWARAHAPLTDPTFQRVLPKTENVRRRVRLEIAAENVAAEAEQGKEK